MNSLQKHVSAQQFLASQFCARNDRLRNLQNIVPVQLHENCFQRIDSRNSPPHIIAHGIRPTQKPAQSNHKPNMSLQNRSNVSDHPTTNFSKRRDYSPNQETLKFLLKSSNKHEESHTPKPMNKSPSPLEIKESVAHLLTGIKRPAPEHEAQSPKNGKRSAQMTPYLSIQQQQPRKSASKQKGHNTTNSMSYGTANLARHVSQLIKKSDYGAHTPTKLTNPTQNTEHSKSKSVVEEQLQYMKLYFEKENDQNGMNVQTPSTFLTTKISLDQQSLGDSAGIKFQTGIRTQQSPPFAKTSELVLQESFPIRTCAIHKNKKAKYSVDDEFKYYCSKCAVLLAGKGIHITEISEMSIAKSSDSQFVESNRQSLAHEPKDAKGIKERELTTFLNLIAESQQNRSQLVQQLALQSTKLNEFYDLQLRQCNEAKGQIEQLLQGAHSRALRKLQAQKQDAQKILQHWFAMLQDHQSESRSIQNDIERNWAAILEGIHFDKLRLILNSYARKFAEMNESLAQAHHQQLQAQSLAPSDLQATMSMIAQVFELQDQMASMLPQKTFATEEDLAQFGQQVRTQPTPPKNRDGQASNRVRTDCSSRTVEPQNFCEYFYDKHNQVASDHPLYESKQSCRANPSTSSHANNLYISFENKDIFMNALEAEKSSKNSQHDTELEMTKQNAIMVLQSYRGSQADIEEEGMLNSSRESAHSTPHSPASGQTKQSYQRTTTKQDVDEQPIMPRDAFQKPKSTFRTLFENDEAAIETSQYRDASLPNSSKKQENGVSPVGSEKFKSILNRISNNQSKTQQFYQQVIQSTQKAPQTPEIQKYEFQETETCKKAIKSNRGSMQIKDSVMNFCDDQQDPSDYENEDDKEVQQMFSSKEMKRSDQKQPVLKSEQTSKKDLNGKNLFCSPNFKDQDLLNVSDSSCDAIV